MILKTYSKEADATLDYELDWSDWLGARTLVISTWVLPAGIINEADSNSSTKTFIQLSGGTWGQSYEVANHVIDSDGREQSNAILIKIQYDVRYATVSEVRASAQSMTVDASPPATDDLVTNLIERISRLFDLECGVREGYFNPPLYPDPTTRTFYGTGTGILRLDPYIEGSLNTMISVPSGYTAPTFIERLGSLLLASSSGLIYPYPAPFNSGWWAGVPITVAAKWGFPSTPSDVTLAIIEWVINVWRETDPAAQRLVNLDGMALREAMPPRVREVVKRYRINSASAVFV